MPYHYITQDGVIVPDTADTLEEVGQEWKDALNRQDLVTTADTPQGVLITQEAILRQAVARNNAELANQINPNLATGVFLDALCGLTGLMRVRATKTRVSGVSLLGLPNTLIPAGTRGETEAGEVFYALSSVMLDASGFGECDFEAEKAGALACPAHALNRILDAVLGWERIDNPAHGLTGQDEESDESLFMRRSLTLERQGISTVEAQISSLYDIPGVRSLQFRENISHNTETIDGIEMLPHSVWVCVEGGTDEDIARSLLNNKTDGAAWNGAIEVGIIEKWSGQKYTVLFDRPMLRPVIVRVTVRRVQYGGVIDPQSAVPDAIMRYRNGEIKGERGFTVGEAVSPYELAWAVNHFYPELFVLKVEAAFAGEDYGTDTLPIALNELATITHGSITVVSA